MNIHKHKVLYTNTLLIIYNVKYEKTVKTKIWLNAYPTIMHITTQNFQFIQPTHFVDLKKII
jgi:tRNA(Phe) wybutosine-synthesizing methylase Tyw3